MKYACLIYLEEARFEAMTQRKRDGHVNASLDHAIELERSGRLIMAQALKAPPHAVRVRRRNGQVSVTDGSFGGTGEHLGGFVLIEARDLNEAIRVAGDMPLARVGTIEVRPFEEPSHIDIPATGEAAQ